MKKTVWVLCIVASAVASTATAESWSTYQGDPTHSGYVPVTLNPSQFQQIWSTTFTGLNGSRFVQPVAAGGGEVFLSISSSSSLNRNEDFYAFNAANGNQLWHQSVGASPFTGLSAPAMGNNMVYVALEGESGTITNAPQMMAFNAVTGSQVFATPYETQSDFLAAPTIVGGQLYSNIGFFGGVGSFDAISGHAGWFTSLPQQFNWSPAADASHLYVYLGALAKTSALYAINQSTGVIDYTISDPSSPGTPGGALSNPLLGSRNDAFVINNNFFSNTQNGLLRFNLAAQSISWEIAGKFLQGMAFAHGALYVIDNGTLEVRDETTGNLLWSWTPPGAQSITKNIVLTDSDVFVSTASATYAIDLNTHNAVWTINQFGSLALADNVLYIESHAENATTASLTAVSVPEPASVVLATIGLCGLLCFCLRRFLPPTFAAPH